MKVNVWNEARRKIGYINNLTDVELVYEDEQFFVVKSDYSNRPYVYCKKWWKYEEIFVPPVPIGTIVSITFGDGKDSSYANEPVKILDYEFTSHYRQTNKVWCVHFEIIGRKGHFSLNYYPVKDCELIPLTEGAKLAWTNGK